MVERDTTAPLAGVRVLDFTQNLPGPYATALMVGMGAEVIKIEPPRGDPARLFGRLFELVNAGKRSVVLDLKTPADLEHARTLVARSDVLLEGFRPGVMASFGLAPAQALELNPRLVYCSLSAYGQHGAYRDHPGHDLNLQAIAGVCDALRSADGRPWGCALPIADLSSGLTAVAAINAALFARERSGSGRAIDVALADTVLSWTYVWCEGLTPADTRLTDALPAVRRFLADRGGKPGASLARLLDSHAAAHRIERVAAAFERSRRWSTLRRIRLHALPHYALYRTRDDRWLSVGIVDEHKFWQALCEGLGLPRLGGLPIGARLVAAEPIRRTLAAVFRRRTLAHWLAHLDRARVPVAPVLPLDEALDDPQIRSRLVDPSGGATVPFPLAGPASGPPPRLGEGNAELLAAASR